MGLLDRFRSKPELRAEDPSWAALSALSPSGQAVNARAAENLSTALACVNAISAAIASLPAWVYQRSEQGREVDPGHALSGMVRNGPSPHQTWPEFIEWLIAQTLLRGNGLAEVLTERGRIVGLKPIPWEWVSVQLLPSGRLAYDVTEAVGMHGSTGRQRRLLADQVLHLRDRSDDGLIGRSRLHRASKTLSAALGIQEFSAATFENVAAPSGVLTAQALLNQESLENLRNNFRLAFSGPHRAARALVLDQGLEWKQLQVVSPEDAELLASRRFSTEEIARLFGVPPPIVGDLTHGSFTNSETAGRWFAQHTLTPWIRKIEAAISKQLFSEAERQTHEIELDLSGFLRGDPETRWQSHEIAVRNGILTPDEVRLIEGWNPLGDRAGEAE